MWGKKSLLSLGDMSMAEKKGFILYYDWEEYFDALESTEEVGELILALFAFAKRGEVEQFTGALKMAFTMMTRTIARDSEKWEQECKNRSEAARKRWDKEKSKVLYNSIPGSTDYNTLYNSIPGSTSYADNSNKIIDNSNQIIDNNKKGVSNETPSAKKSASKKFVKPKVEEIAEYIKEKEYGINAQQFYDFYESKGWKVGNTPMKDWKAAVRNWHSRAYGSGTAEKPKQPTGNPNAAYDLDRWHEEADNMDFDALRKQMFGGNT